MFRITTDVIWEGLALHQWTDAQLQQMQARLVQVDFLAEIEGSFQAERAWGIKFIEYFRKKPNRGEELSNTGFMDGESKDSRTTMEHLTEGMKVCFFNIVPSGWFYWEQYNYAQSFPMPVNAAQTRRIEPARCAEAQRDLEKKLSGNFKVLQHRMFSGLLLPALSRAQMKAAEGQTVADEAVIGCALERARLANGKFPEQLQALVPRFVEKLPNDVISGEPLIYRLTKDGQFVLYSVAWNGKDDGGVVTLTQAPGESNKYPQDWVWRSQPKP
jgi:hypothetical protein